MAAAHGRTGPKRLGLHNWCSPHTHAHTHTHHHQHIAAHLVHRVTYISLLQYFTQKGDGRRQGEGGTVR